MNSRMLTDIVHAGLADFGLGTDIAAKPKGRARETEWLPNEPGFGIRHYPNGRSVFIVQARMEGRNRTVTIGSAAVLSQAQAAKVARLVLAHAWVGEDPAATKKRKKAAPLFKDFMEEFWTKWSPRWSAKTQSINAGRRRLYLDGSFRALGIDEIDEAHVADWFAAVNEETTPGAANMVHSLLNLMMNKAEDWGYRRDHTNPCRDVKRNRRGVCERFLNDEELERLGGVLREDRAAEDIVSKLTAIAVTLLLLTGCRRSEILKLQWGDVRGNRIKLRHGKTGPRTIWLSREVVAIIATIPRRNNVDWLFWNPKSGKPISDIQWRWTQIRKRADLEGVRLHDLRHTFASHAAMSNETLPMIGKLLGHREVKSTARYTHLDDNHVLQSVEEIGAAIGRMMPMGRDCIPSFDAIQLDGYRTS